MQEQQFNRRRAAAMNIRMQAMSQQTSSIPAQSSTVGGSKEEMSPTAMSPHHGNSMGGMGSPHHVSGVKPGTQQQQSTQKPPPAVLQVVKQVRIINFIQQISVI